MYHRIMSTCEEISLWALTPPPPTPGLTVLFRIPSKDSSLLAQKRNLELGAGPTVECFNTTPLQVGGAVPFPAAARISQ